MHQEKYDLNWHKYSEHLREMLHGMMKSNELTDVTLVCDDKTQFKAHKIVLSACSSVFKSIINDLPQKSSVIYLRGIQHQEMESLLEFMYLGVATFYQERMNEFLNVAKDLEIKQLSKHVKFPIENESNEEPEIPNEKYTELKVEQETNTSDDKSNNSARSVRLRDHSLFQNSSERRFTCGQCGNKFTQKVDMKRHIQSVHEGIRYSCNQCDLQFTRQGSLNLHIKTIHEGLKFPCNQCDQQFTQKGSVETHIKSIHKKSDHAVDL